MQDANRMEKRHTSCSHSGKTPAGSGKTPYLRLMGVGVCRAQYNFTTKLCTQKVGGNLATWRRSPTSIASPSLRRIVSTVGGQCGTGRMTLAGITITFTGYNSQWQSQIQLLVAIHNHNHNHNHNHWYQLLITITITITGCNSLCNAPHRPVPFVRHLCHCLLLEHSEQLLQ